VSPAASRRGAATEATSGVARSPAFSCASAEPAFAAVTLAAKNTSLLTVRADDGPKTIGELITAAKRNAGRGARVSKSRASASSRVVMVKWTLTLFFRAIRANSSASRATKSDLVVIPSEKPRSPANTSSIRRVIRKRRSAG